MLGVSHGFGNAQLDLSCMRDLWIADCLIMFRSVEMSGYNCACTVCSHAPCLLDTSRVRLQQKMLSLAGPMMAEYVTVLMCSHSVG